MGIECDQTRLENFVPAVCRPFLRGSSEQSLDVALADFGAILRGRNIFRDISFRPSPEENRVTEGDDTCTAAVGGACCGCLCARVRRLIFAQFLTRFPNLKTKLQ